MKTLRIVEAALLAAFAAALSLSIAAMEVAFLGALFVRLVRHLRGERWCLAPRSLLLATAVLAVTWIGCGLIAPEPWESVRWVLRLYQVLLVFLVAEHASSDRGARRLLIAYVIGVLLGVLYGLGEWWSQGASLNQRLEGGFSTAMTSGNVLALGWVALVAILGGAASWGGPVRKLIAAAAVLSPIALAAAATRSSWLGAFVAMPWIALRSPRRWVAATAFVIAFLMTFAVPVLRERGATKTVTPEYTAEGRVSLWKSGWELFRKRPITGFGLADHGKRIAAYRRADATFVAGHFHSNPVQVLVSTGVVGALAYAGFHATLLALLWRRRGALAVAALGVWIAFHVSGFFDWSFGDAEVTYQLFFWMGLGLADAACSLTRPEPGR